MKISVIIPVYNAERYLKRCIDSIVGQRHDLFEIILVDDGSQDQSLEICRAYENGYKNIRVIRRENGGEGAARNSGLEVAGGEWILFVDADDIVGNDLCMALEESLDDQSDFILFESEKITNGSDAHSKPDERYREVVMECDGGMREKLLQNTFLAKRLLEDFGCPLRSVWGKLYRTSFLKEHHIMFDEGVPVGTDMLFSLKVYSVVNFFKCVYWNIYYYFQNEDSITYRYKPEYEKMVAAYDGAIAPWLKAFPKYEPYFFLYRMNDIILFMKYVFFNKENPSGEREKRREAKRVFCSGNYPEYYRISRKCRLLRNYGMGKRVTFWLAVHGFYVPLKLIHYMRYRHF